MTFYTQWKRFKTLQQNKGIERRDCCTRVAQYHSTEYELQKLLYLPRQQTQHHDKKGRALPKLDLVSISFPIEIPIYNHTA